MEASVLSLRVVVDIQGLGDFGKDPRWVIGRKAAVRRTPGCYRTEDHAMIQDKHAGGASTRSARGVAPVAA
eukprot:718917-Hanusia_phi.AAC.1